MNLDRIGAACQPYLLSLFRFITGLLFLHYGVAKIFKFPPLRYLRGRHAALAVASPACSSSCSGRC